MSVLLKKPSVQLGHAKSAADAVRPEWWNGLELAVCPLLGTTGDVVFDAVRQRPFSFNDAPAWVIEGNGWAIDLDGSDYLNSAEPVDRPFLGEITLVWCGTIDTGSAFRHFMGKHTGNGATNNPFDFRTHSDATPSLRLIRSAGASSVQWEGPATTLGESHLYGAVVDVASATAEFYVDDTRTTNTQSAITPTGSGAAIRIGRRADGAVQMDGKLEAAYIWSRRLNHNEMTMIAHDFLAPFHERHFLIAAEAAAAAGNAMPTAMDHYRRMRVA